MRKLCFLLVGLTTLVLPACAAKPQELIIGKWETTDPLGKTQIAEFAKDGNTSWPVPFTALRVDGKYKFVDDKHIELELPGTGKMQKSVEVTRETLTLTDDKGKAQIYKRVK